MEYKRIIFSRSRSHKDYIKKADLLTILSKDPCSQILNDLGIKIMKSDTVADLFEKADSYNDAISDKNFQIPVVSDYNIKTGNSDSDDKLRSMFHVNERFDFLEDFSKMVLNEEANSLVVTGEGGLGKTYTIKKMLKVCNVHEDLYKFVKGYCTPFTLYKTLYDNNGKTIIFDDCDSVLDEKTSQNLLKNALDSYSERTLSWGSKAAEKDNYPTEFDFCGSIIFISNKSKSKIYQPLLSRSYVVDLSMSVDEMLERMEFISASFSSDNNYNYDSVKKSISFLKKNKQHCINMSMRTLIDIVRIYESGSHNWERLALYTIMNE